MKRSPAAAFWLSLIPGAGHVYVGQVLKGIILIIVTGSVIQIVSSGADGFGITIPFVWLFAMLDAHRAAIEVNRRFAAGLEIPRGGDAAPAKWWGYVLIVLGGLFLLESFDLIDFDWIWKLWPLGLIALGVYVLRRKPDPASASPQTPYAPPDLMRSAPPGPEGLEDAESPAPIATSEEERENA